MALSDREASALADMAAALRPEWNARSVRAYLAAKHRARAYQDLGLALAAVCLAEDAKTPAALELDWPWTVAAAARRQGGTPRVGPEQGAERCRVPGHEHEEARGCRLCAADRLAILPDEDDGPVCGLVHPTLPDVTCWATAAGHSLHRGVAWHGGLHVEIVSWRDPEPEPVETPEEVSAS